MHILVVESSTKGILQHLKPASKACVRFRTRMQWPTHGARRMTPSHVPTTSRIARRRKRHTPNSKVLEDAHGHLRRLKAQIFNKTCMDKSMYPCCETPPRPEVRGPGCPDLGRTQVAFLFFFVHGLEGCSRCLKSCLGGSWCLPLPRVFV